MEQAFNSNPNQKKIKVNKEKCNNNSANNYYATINLKALQKAMHSLTPKAFELWIYFSKNQERILFLLVKSWFFKLKQCTKYIIS